MDEQLAAILAHYVSLAQHQAWKQYVWHRVNQMAEECREFRELPELLTKQMREIANDARQNNI